MTNMDSGGQFIEGDRLVLTALTADNVDLDAYLRWMNDPEITRFLESRFRPHGRSDLLEYMDRDRADPVTLSLAVTLQDGGRHIGNIKLGPINWIHRSADIGLIIGEKDCWRKGYASEAIGLLSEFAFSVLNLRRLTAGCYGSNPGSAKAFERAGFVIEGRRPEHYFDRGAYVERILLARNR